MTERELTTHIVVHTAAAEGDPSVEDIRRWHVEGNGWDDIGYHYVVRKDGTIEPGRPENLVGAHCRDMGMNHNSVGICCSGHGDVNDFSEQQKDSLARLCRSMQQEFDIPTENIIGHRETGANKTCPGEKVDMDEIRSLVANPKNWTVSSSSIHFNNFWDEDDLRIPNDADNDGIRDDGRIPGKSRPTKDIAIPDKTFWDKVKRTAKGKNKTGKTIYGVIGAGVMLLTGVNIEPLILTQNNITMEIIDLFTNGELLAWLFGLLATFLGGLAAKKDKEKTEAEKQRDIVIQKAQTGLDILSAAKRKDSEDGTALSDKEKDTFMAQAEKTLQSMVDWGVAVVGKKVYGLFGRQKPN